MTKRLAQLLPFSVLILIVTSLFIAFLNSEFSLVRLLQLPNNDSQNYDSDIDQQTNDISQSLTSLTSTVQNNSLDTNPIQFLPSENTTETIQQHDALYASNPSDFNEAPVESSRRRPQQPPTLPHCGHALLFSSARHGSTWLIDSIEQCRFQKRGKYSQANENSELWVPGHKLLANASVNEALDRLENLCSLKIFPISFHHGDEVEQVVLGAKAMGMPIIVLKRSIESVFISLQKAKRDHVWNRISPSGADDSQPYFDNTDPGFLSFRRAKLAYFGRVHETLERLNVHDVDVFDYEDIRDEEYIVAEKSGCYIHNCNFQ